MREKLIELLSTAGWNLYQDGEHSKRQIADHLIANGVTFAKDINVPSKWIPVTERLPEKNGDYLAFESSNIFRSTRVLSFAKDGRKIDKYDFRDEWKNVWYRYDSEWGHITIDRVTHWMPLPEPPKGE